MVTCAVMLSGMEAFACTGLLVGKKASVDGSVMISYAADSHTLYGELYRWPAATWPKGAMLDIIEWDTHKPLGQIPQVEQTYSVVGNMNEHQVAITESTFGGRPELVDTTGIMDYGSLIYVTLQRSKTAREAIRIMTDLVKDYGYYSSGETFSIADKNEAWVMEMIGKGPGNKGAVWVANLPALHHHRDPRRRRYRQGAGRQDLRGRLRQRHQRHRLRAGSGWRQGPSCAPRR